MTMIGKLLCRLGLHKWGYTAWEIGRYKHHLRIYHLRICQRDHCKRVEKAMYNMLDFDWVKVELITGEE